jgi:hypothetical protein
MIYLTIHHAQYRRKSRGRGAEEAQAAAAEFEAALPARPRVDGAALPCLTDRNAMRYRLLLRLKALLRSFQDALGW